MNLQILPSSPASCSDEERKALYELDGRCFNRPWTLDAWHTEFERRFARVWIGRQETQLLGYCVCWYLKPEAELLRIAVDPALRGRKIGAALLAWALQEGAQAGCSSMSLEVQHDNLAAIALYTRAGFEACGRRPGYYQGVDALLMRCELEAP